MVAEGMNLTLKSLGPMPCLEALGYTWSLSHHNGWGHVGRVWSEKLGGSRNSLGPDIDTESLPRGDRSLSTA